MSKIRTAERFSTRKSLRKHSKNEAKSKKSRRYSKNNLRMKKINFSISQEWKRKTVVGENERVERTFFHLLHE